MIKEMEKLQPAMVELLQKLVELESCSKDKAAVDSLVDFLAHEVERRGGKPQILPQNESGNHLRAEWGEGQEQILILCHIDTVHPVGSIKKRPFRVEGDKVYGPGVYDMKGGAVQTLFAMECLHSQGWPLKRRVVALFTGDEETGSVTSRSIIEEEALKSKVVFVLEPGAPPQGAIKTSRKGVGEFKLVVEGKAAHAGADPQAGASAVLELAHQIFYLQGLTDYEAGVTVNVGHVVGGTASNVVADHAEAYIDLRVPTMEQAERVLPLILGVRPKLEGTTVHMTGGLERPPLERTAAIVGLFETAKAIAEELGFQLEEGSSGGGSDGNFTASLGVPTLDGLGPVGDGAHAQDEHLLASKLPERTALLIGLLHRVGNA